MGLFGKKYPLKADIKVEEKWSISTGHTDRGVLFVRMNNGLRDLAGHPDYPFQVGIAIPLRDKNENGLPTPNEQKSLDVIEEEIYQKICFDNEILLATILTFPEVREFSFYASDPEVVKERFFLAKNSISSHELQLNIQKDKDWKVYKALSK
jgi:hypothetical protein